MKKICITKEWEFFFDSCIPIDVGILYAGFKTAACYLRYGYGK